MARKAPRRKAPKKPKKSAAKPARPSGHASLAMVQAGMHDLTNLSTAVKAYLELLNSQSRLEEKQKYYVDRAREQVEMIVDLVREMREKIQ